MSLIGSLAQEAVGMVKNKAEAAYDDKEKIKGMVKSLQVEEGTHGDAFDNRYDAMRHIAGSLMASDLPLGVGRVATSGYEALQAFGNGQKYSLASKMDLINNEVGRTLYEGLSDEDRDNLTPERAFEIAKAHVEQYEALQDFGDLPEDFAAPIYGWGHSSAKGSGTSALTEEDFKNRKITYAADGGLVASDDGGRGRGLMGNKTDFQEVSPIKTLFTEVDDTKNYHNRPSDEDFSKSGIMYGTPNRPSDEEYHSEIELPLLRGDIMDVAMDYFAKVEGTETAVVNGTTTYPYGVEEGKFAGVDREDFKKEDGTYDDRGFASEVGETHLETLEEKHPDFHDYPDGVKLALFSYKFNYGLGTTVLKKAKEAAALTDTTSQNDKYMEAVKAMLDTFGAKDTSKTNGKGAMLGLVDRRASEYNKAAEDLGKPLITKYSLQNKGTGSEAIYYAADGSVIETVTSTYKVHKNSKSGTRKVDTDDTTALAEGGLVASDDEELPEELYTGGMVGMMTPTLEVIVGHDEESGNPIPAGSTDKEVRDDVEALLSEGEYVLPADVVRWHGLKHIQEMRDEAKCGLMCMSMDGQIKTPESDEDYEEPSDEDDDEDVEVTEEGNEIEVVDNTDEKKIKAFDGGLVNAAITPSVGGFFSSALDQGRGASEGGESGDASTSLGYLVRRLVRGSDGRMIVRYFHPETGTYVDDPTGYEVLDQSAYNSLTGPGMQEPDSGADTVAEEVVAEASSTGSRDERYTLPDDATQTTPIERNQWNNYGFEEPNKLVSMGAGLLGGPLIGGALRMGQGMNNAEAVDAARQDLGMEGLGWWDKVKGSFTGKYNDGVIGRGKIGDNDYSAGFGGRVYEDQYGNKITSLTPNEYKKRTAAQDIDISKLPSAFDAPSSSSSSGIMSSQVIPDPDGVVVSPLADTTSVVERPSSDWWDDIDEPIDDYSLRDGLTPATESDPWAGYGEAMQAKNDYLTDHMDTESSGTGESSNERTGIMSHFENPTAHKMFGKSYSDLTDDEKMATALRSQIDAGNANMAEGKRYEEIMGRINATNNASSGGGGNSNKDNNNSSRNNNNNNSSSKNDTPRGSVATASPKTKQEVKDSLAYAEKKYGGLNTRGR